MRSTYLLALDQGTSSSRAIIYSANGKEIATHSETFSQYYPKPGWVEHDPHEIWKTVEMVIAKSIRKAKISPHQIAGIGITNQRETVVVWDRLTGKPVHRAIVWQDRRTSELCENYKSKLGESFIRNKTGLVWDAYFSATKIKWILDHYPKLRVLANAGVIICGTIDTWIVWNLTNGKHHVTDKTNASRTMLMNLRTHEWDPELLSIFKIPLKMLPKIKASGDLFGEVTSSRLLPTGVKIHAVIGDQQAALYGQDCYQKGQGKNTYGTGCFTMINLGSSYHKPVQGLLTTIASDQEGNAAYAYEGSVFIAGAAVQWLKEEMCFFKKNRELVPLAKSVKTSGGVTVIPAFVGLGSPYWNSIIRGQILGITRGTNKAHIVRATLESVAHLTSDVIDAIRERANIHLKELRVDGGMTQNSFLMQIQSDFLQIPVWVSKRPESTAWGVARLAGLKLGFWKLTAPVSIRSNYVVYRPKISPQDALQLRTRWKKIIKSAISNV